jgi:hypothetical protein
MKNTDSTKGGALVGMTFGTSGTRAAGAVFALLAECAVEMTQKAKRGARKILMNDSGRWKEETFITMAHLY